MECNLPDLTDIQNHRIREILEETNVFDSQSICPEICKIEKSKKNLVLSISPNAKRPIVLKLFSSADSLQNEKKIYSFGQKNIFSKSDNLPEIKYAIPELIHKGDDYIITQYIQGENTMDMFTTQMEDPWNQPLLQQVITDLLQWVIRFSNVYKLVPLDCHIRNFILHQDTIYGVDFEELGVSDEKSLLKVFATLYFSILGAYPGVIEGLKLTEKAKIGVYLIRRILLSPEFQDIPITQIIPSFLEYVRTEAAAVVQRRINLDRGQGYNTQKIKENLDYVFSYIRSDFT
ncbi:MAG: hypothetical protein EU530_04405 [Promethearchaeota archaeon]|nr:MAG: hypothetical protein EU530_04405 [Candidatus Lokiarchaeota archaeon]